MAGSSANEEQSISDLDLPKPESATKRTTLSVNGVQCHLGRLLLQESIARSQRQKGSNELLKGELIEFLLKHEQRHLSDGKDGFER